MTIDEAISREIHLAKEQRSYIGTTWNKEYSKKCEEYAKEHEQLAEWLEELKAIKSDGFTDDLLNMGFSKGYRKALDDFVNVSKENILFKTFGLRECDIEQIAEQLKAGGNNDRL